MRAAKHEKQPSVRLALARLMKASASCSKGCFKGNRKIKRLFSLSATLCWPRKRSIAPVFTEKLPTLDAYSNPSSSRNRLTPRHSERLARARAERDRQARCSTAVNRGSGGLKERQRSCRGAWRRARRQAQMREDSDNHRRLFDGGDNLEVAATLRAVFEVDIEHALEQPRPVHARRCFMCGVGRVIAGFLRWARHDRGTQPGMGCEHAVKNGSDAGAVAAPRGPGAA
ncbi:MAG: hypothetical protein JWM26_3071 [Betaproteobacteria bacterium]|nr:hypothetical protein [Betaproteobacteria bacterium]